MDVFIPEEYVSRRRMEKKAAAAAAAALASANGSHSHYESHTSSQMHDKSTNKTHSSHSKTQNNANSFLSENAIFTFFSA